MSVVEVKIQLKFILISYNRSIESKISIEIIINLLKQTKTYKCQEDTHNHLNMPHQHPTFPQLLLEETSELPETSELEPSHNSLKQRPKDQRPPSLSQ